MRTTDARPTSAILTEVNARAMAHFKDMRALLVPPSSPDAATCEVMLAMQLAVRGHEVPFKVHAMRAMGQGVSLSQLETLLLAGVGVSLIAFEAGRAVQWAREAHEEFLQAAPSPAQAGLDFQ